MDKRINEREVIIDPLKRWAEYYFSDVSCGWPVEPDHESLFHMFGWNHRMRYNSDLQYLESLDSSEEISVLSHYAGEKFMNILIVRAEPRIGVYTPVATMFNGVLKFNDMANLPHLFRGTRITITRKDSAVVLRALGVGLRGASGFGLRVEQESWEATSRRSALGVGALAIP